METKKGLSGSTLKLIAIITMFIDHFGATILGRIILASGYGDAQTVLAFAKEHMALVVTYEIMRFIGRLGFPLFVFLLVEGFHYTRNKYKYAERLALFALLSEIPFDLAVKGKILEFSHQNVFFTLLIGLLTLIVYEKVEQKFTSSHAIKNILSILVFAVGIGIAVFLKTDYDGWGVLVIIVMYLLRYSKFKEMLFGCILLTIMSFGEFTCFLDLIPVKMYNGKRGLKLKYFFYFFYPVHLLLLFILACLLGYGNVNML